MSLCENLACQQGVWRSSFWRFSPQLSLTECLDLWLTTSCKLKCFSGYCQVQMFKGVKEYIKKRPCIIRRAKSDLKIYSKWCTYHLKESKLYSTIHMPLEKHNLKRRAKSHYLSQISSLIIAGATSLGGMGGGWRTPDTLISDYLHVKSRGHLFQSCHSHSRLWPFFHHWKGALI